MNYELIFNIIGIVGVSLILLSYLLLQLEKISSKDLLYLLMNLKGSALVIVSLFWSWNLPSFIIEVSWLFISFFGTYKYIRGNR